MKTQISRNSFNADKRYSGVYQQMGRMLTDADWNEFSELAKNRLAEALTDIIGTGTPRGRGIVDITVNPDDSVDYKLQWGHAYVDGIAAQVEPAMDAVLTDPLGIAFEYQHQADFPSAPALPETDFIYYLDVWERNVNALEDGDLLDAGLHGADTCTRTQTMAQVKWCETGVDPEDWSVNPTIGNALLNLTIRQGSTEPDPCDPCAEEIALQDKVGNYLFRMEVHDVEYDSSEQPRRVTIKWSSENGAEQYAISELPIGFQSEFWAYEFFHGEPNDFSSEKHLGKHLVPGFTPSRGELVNGYPDSEPVGYALVRRWDGFCTFEKSGTDWVLVADSGFDRSVVMSDSLGVNAHGHVSNGTTVTLNFDSLTAQLELAEWQALAGDYWLAEVRQATDVAGTDILVDALPDGIEHHYMTLGLMSDGTFTAADSDSCKRFEFPPLTDIKADDVCYDNSACDMPDVKTVQDALDHLCKEKDLAWHNKHLHGWGIVCGLIVECCDRHDDEDYYDEFDGGRDTINIEETDDYYHQRRDVCITKGYALTCDGEDIVLDQHRNVDIMRQIEELQERGVNVLNEAGEGSVFLRVDLGSNGQPVFRVEPYDADKHKSNIFEGTLLMDFFENCIMDLVYAVVGEFNFLNPDEVEEIENGETGLVSNERRKLVSVLNLIIQLVNVDNGSYVFLSRKEHNILKDFYLSLQDLLRSKTFCAMFEGDEFPEYPFPQIRMTTMFGKNLHTRVKVHPNGNDIYSYNGVDNTINVYSRAKGELVKVIEMPSAEGAQVTAITFSNDGSLLFAAANVRGADTIFGISRINDDHKWEEMIILCDILVSEMEVSPEDRGLIYALGLNKGLYFLRPEILTNEPDAQPSPVYAFNAVGHMKIDFNDNYAYCTASTADIKTEIYNRIAICSLNAEGENLQPKVLMEITDPNGGEYSGTDGIEISVQPKFERANLYVIANSFNSNNKLLLTFNNPLFADEKPFASNITSLDENTPISLAFHDDVDNLILGFEDDYRLQLFTPDGNPGRSFRTPVQIQPTDIVVNKTNKEVNVLNYVSNTITVIAAEELIWTTERLNQLYEYRRAILFAFYSLIGNVLQYLKDCFCHHLLVKCPTCDEDDIIYLAQIEIRENEIYKICNFDKRKYVKSFPTIDYWLSLVPVMPMVGWLVEKLCCSVIPNIFDNYRDTVVRKANVETVSKPQQTNIASATQVRSGIQTVQKTDVKSAVRAQSKRASLIGRLGADTLTTGVKVNQVNQPGLAKTALLKAKTDDAVMEFERNDIKVAEVETYDAAKANNYLKAYVDTPERIERGSTVSLVEKDGKVMYYAVKKPEVTADLGSNTELKNELQLIQKEKASLNTELVSMKKELNNLQLARLEESKKLSEAKVSRDSLAKEIVTLNTQLAEVSEMQKDIVVEVNKARPASNLDEVDVKMKNQFNKVGVVTVEELALADVNKLSKDSGMEKAKVKLAIDAAKLKIKR